MEQQELQELKAHVLSQFESMKQRGVPFTQWKCPHCQKVNECPCGEVHITPDTCEWKHSKSCYECGAPAFVNVYADGLTEAITFDDRFERKRKDNLATALSSSKNSDALFDAAKPLIDYLAANYHPHVKALVTSTNAEVLKGLMMVHTVVKD